MLEAVLKFNLHDPKQKKLFRLASDIESITFGIEAYFDWLDDLTENDLAEKTTDDYKNELIKCFEAYGVKL